MTDEPDLFANLPSVKSPRLLWMEEHGITVRRKESSIGQSWTVAKGKTRCRSTRCELDALALLAAKLNLKLWNQ